ncbi:MAG: 3-phosphoshikimate 1-carboxyvinyltransferase [Ruminococcaceae bacterium]|nr:3-phosphoshikimate 1-carboxyvinyltransferase [Oscillospiraceae bacterium]
MDITIQPGRLNGTVRIIPSKSQAHRLLICAAFADKETEIICPETNEDISATADCLNALGAQIRRTDNGYCVTPAHTIPEIATLNCKESGSTLRFMLPIVGALGVDTTFHLSGRLPDRPLSPLKEEMERMGCTISIPQRGLLRCTGKLKVGSYQIDGSVSSQFISGLLFALVLINKECTLTVTGKVESRPYIDLTMNALQMFGANICGNRISPSLPLTSPEKLTVEGDWSNAAFFYAANALGSSIQIENLREDSAQGDRICKEILSTLGPMNVDATDIPDLVPILSVAASAKFGGRFTGIGRLRLKESDRIASTVAMLRAFGIEAEADENTLTVHSGHFSSCTVQSENDHRIAMASAIAATVADGPVTILNAQCVSKSYPAFWDVYKQLGGNYEQHIR